MPVSSPPASRRPAQAPATFRGRPVDMVIDVRSKLEFLLGHLAGAICIPVDALGARIGAQAGIGFDSTILVYCAGGARSAAAAALLASMGYRHVTDGGAMSDAARDYAG